MLTTQAIVKMTNGSTSKDFQPIVQLLEIKKTSEFYDFWISDGELFCKATYRSYEYKEAIDQDIISLYQIIKLIDYRKADKSENAQFLIFQFLILHNPNNQFGKPIELLIENNQQSQESKPLLINQIFGLEKWSVKARVLKKENIRSYDNGYYFRIYIVDRDDNIAKGLFFRECVNIFFDNIIQGKVYDFINADVKIPDYVKNKEKWLLFDIFFNSSSIIKEIEDDKSIPISSEKISKDDYQKNFMDKKNIKPSSPRVSEINEENINRPHNEIESLPKERENPEKISPRKINENIIQNPLSFSIKPILLNLSTIHEILTKVSQSSQLYSENFEVLCTIGKISNNITNIIYPSCKNQKCRRKLSLTDNEEYLCTYCGELSKVPYYRFRIYLSIYDSTGNMPVKFFDDIGHQLFGKTANQIYYGYTLNPDNINSILFKSMWINVIATIRAKYEETDWSYIITSIKPAINAFDTILKDLKTVHDMITQ